MPDNLCNTISSQLTKNNIMNSNKNQEEVVKLAQYTAQRLLDRLLEGSYTIRYDETLSGKDIYKDLKNGVTKDLLFNNIESFDVHLNYLVHNRLDYLQYEGFIVLDGKMFRAQTEAEMEEFLTVE